MLPNDTSSAMATVYEREGRLFVQRNDRTVWNTAGFWIGAGPVTELLSSDPPASIGRGVLDALADSQVEVPVPPRGTDLEAPLRKAVGVRSRRALMRATRACEVCRVGNNLRIVPYNNGGSVGENRGYRPNLAEADTLPTTASENEVGQAVLAALARATVV